VFGSGLWFGTNTVVIKDNVVSEKPQQKEPKKQLNATAKSATP
jgi:hypothetical protein